MPNNSITWQNLLTQIGISPEKLGIIKIANPFSEKNTKKKDNDNEDNVKKISLIDALIIPSTLYLEDKSYDFSSFIKGEDLKLALNILDSYCTGATIENKGEVFFYSGSENNELSTVVKCWTNFYECFADINPKMQRKDMKNNVEKLINEFTPQSALPLSNGNPFCFTTCLQSIRSEDFCYKIAVYSVLASIWPVLQLVLSNDSTSLSEKYHLDKDTLCKQLKIIYEVLIPHKLTLNNFRYALIPEYEQKEFLARFINPTLDEHNFPSGLFKTSAPSLTRLFRGDTFKGAMDFLKAITLPEFSHAEFSSKLLPYRKYKYLNRVRDLWASYLTENPQSRLSLSSLISNYYESFENNIWIVRFSTSRDYLDLIEKLCSIKDKPDDWSTEDGDFFIYQLSVFFIITLTWPVWEKFTDLNVSPTQRKSLSSTTAQEGGRNLLLTLSDLLFPPNLVESNPEETQEEYPVEDADTLYEDAAALFNDYQDVNATVEILEKIIAHYRGLASNETLGKTYSLLAKCHEENADIIPAWIGTLKDIQYEAQRYGTDSFCSSVPEIKPHRKRATAIEDGLYYIKCSDKKIKYWIDSTIPTNWKSLSSKLRQRASTDSKENTPQSELDFTSPEVLSSNIRFIFAEDHYEQNINDALSILETFRLLALKDDVDSSTWGKIELVVRCEQEKAIPLLDTACSFLGEIDDEGNCVFQNNPIRIHLLDERKRSADLLYARHPLFYPLTVSRNQESTDRRKFNLVILSTNTDIAHATWLIRQAFWLLPHYTVSVDSTITVLSPHYKELAHMVTTLCPGLSTFITYDNTTPDALPENFPVKIDDISFPKIDFCNLRLTSTRDLENFVETKVHDNELLYYIVDGTSDLEAINLGIRIREISIRETLRRKILKKYIPGENVIAVRCDNPDYANLSKQLIVPKEAEHDNRWFNDYKLISYGSVQELFSWDELIGGQIEFMSECMHLQYCTASGEDYDYESDAPKEYIWSYYRRFYNRDSSYSAAISMPYRLFEAGVVLRPSEWTFSDSNSYWSEKNRNILADRFNDDRELDDEALIKWEHSRFCCYLLSTGWLPASPQQVKYYMGNGVSRHTLQIAKLHPCLCSWDDLVKLYDILHQAYLGSEDAFGNYKRNDKFKNFSEDDSNYFQQLNYDNIFQTADMLKAQPLPFSRKTNMTEKSSTR